MSKLERHSTVKSMLVGLSFKEMAVFSHLFPHKIRKTEQNNTFKNTKVVYNPYILHKYAKIKDIKNLERAIGYSSPNNYMMPNSLWQQSSFLTWISISLRTFGIMHGRMVFDTQNCINFQTKPKPHWVRMNNFGSDWNKGRNVIGIECNRNAYSIPKKNISLQ